MKLVVSDGTPLNILIRVDQVHLLPTFFQSVVVPQSVAEEMTHPRTPDVVRAFVQSPPRWFSVQTPENAVDRSVKHRGESDAIILAQEIKADGILLDEDKARKRAERAGLIVTGTIGLLERAAGEGLIKDLAEVHQQIREGRFHVSERILAESLERHLGKSQERENVRDSDEGRER